MRYGIIVASTALLSCARVPVVGADPSGQRPVAGDNNGDGRVDLSDGLVVLRSQLSGGPRAVCFGAADIDQDHRVDLGDGFAIWYAIFAGNTTLPEEIEAGWCDTWDTRAAAPEGRLALGLEADGKVKAAAGESVSADVLVTLVSQDLAVEGWSLAAVADGCEITGASTAGTKGADRRDAEPGQRDGGFDRTEIVDGVASSALVLGWLSVVALAPSKDAVVLLNLELSLEAPSSGCKTCTVALEDGHATGGAEVVNLLSVGGYSYRPELPSTEIEVCAK